jgi:hypothetical protein
VRVAALAFVGLILFLLMVFTVNVWDKCHDPIKEGQAMLDAASADLAGRPYDDRCFLPQIWRDLGVRSD